MIFPLGRMPSLIPSWGLSFVDFRASSAPTDLAQNVRDYAMPKAAEIEAIIGPIEITSAFRSDARNVAAGGEETSDHKTGKAFDFKSKLGLSAEQVAERLWKSGLSVDQLIWYDASRGGHVHVGNRGPANRGMWMHAPSTGGYAHWAPGVSSGTVAQAVNLAIPSRALSFARKVPNWVWWIGGVGVLALLLLRRSGRLRSRYPRSAPRYISVPIS